MIQIETQIWPTVIKILDAVAQIVNQVSVHDRVKVTDVAMAVMIFTKAPKDWPASIHSARIGQLLARSTDAQFEITHAMALFPPGKEMLKMVRSKAEAMSHGTARMQGFMTACSEMMPTIAPFISNSSDIDRLQVMRTMLDKLADRLRPLQIEDVAAMKSPDAKESCSAFTTTMHELMQTLLKEIYNRMMETIPAAEWSTTWSMSIGEILTVIKSIVTSIRDNSLISQIITTSGADRPTAIESDWFTNAIDEAIHYLALCDRGAALMAMEGSAITPDEMNAFQSLIGRYDGIGSDWASVVARDVNSEITARSFTSTIRDRFYGLLGSRP